MDRKDDSTLFSRIMFIVPPSFHLEDYKDFKSKTPVFTIPYGVLSIYTYLKKMLGKDIAFELVDLNVLAYKKCASDEEVIRVIREEIANYIAEMRPDIIAISALFNVCYSYLESICDIIEQTGSRAKLLIGGGLATNMYETILEKFCRIDAVCFAEGEVPVFKLCAASSYEEGIADSTAWVTRRTLAEGKKPEPDFVIDLDDIPFLEYGAISLEDYQGRSYTMSQRKQKNTEMALHTSRGCPFNCVFCANGSVHGKHVRYMSKERVVSDVRRMVREYGMTVLLIEDDHFLSNRERAVYILKAIAELNIRVEFPNGVAVYAINEDIAKLMRAAGTVTATLACESGSSYVLKNIINKPLRVDMIHNAVKCLKMVGINVHGFFVVGLPGETYEHRRETAELIKTVSFDWVYIFIAVPIVGSRLYKMCKENGWLVNDEFSNHYVTKGNIKTDTIKPEEIEKEAYLLNLELNFINNHNLKNDVSKAVSYFEPIADRYPFHALAWWGLSRAYNELGDYNRASDCEKKYLKIIREDEEWNGYFKHFKLVE